MKTRTITQYACDHCGKTRLRKSAMEKHEKHCVKNPDRDCRMCDQTGGHARTVASLVEEFQQQCNRRDWETGFCYDMPLHVVDKLRKAVESCPACMLAVIVQGNFTPVSASEFRNPWSYKDEREAFWHDINEEHARMVGW